MFTHPESFVAEFFGVLSFLDDLMEELLMRPQLSIVISHCKIRQPHRHKFSSPPSSTRTVLIMRRVRECGFSAQADLPSSCFTRERIRSASSAMIKSVVLASPSRLSVGGTWYVASSVKSSNHSSRRHSSSRAASLKKSSSTSYLVWGSA